MEPQISVRRAVATDWPTLVAYNQAMAWETEKKELSETILAHGVQAALNDPQRGLYFVAEIGQKVIGQLLITTEWSDWRNGWFWWIQSVYVHPQARRQGVFRELYEEVVRQGQLQGDVVGIRLYVEHENTVAQQTYQKLGMSETIYQLYERSPL